MSRRSRRLSEAKEAAAVLQNGDLPNSRKRTKLDTEGMNESSSSNIQDAMNNAAKKVNHKIGSSKKSPKTNLKDVPLKERMKTAGESDVHKNSKIDGVESLSKSVRDFGVDEKASTSHTSTEDTATGFDLANAEGESLAVILSQGLTSSDAEKIDAVLSKTDARTISATLNDLPITQVLPLLKEIEYRCRNRRHFESSWMRWLQCIFSKHMAYLCTISTLKEDLASLFGWFRKRASSMDELLQLSGKLSLINEQINRRMCPQIFSTQQPTISFEDDGDELSETSGEMDDVDEEESIGSVEDWWDDDEVGSEPSSGDGEGEGEGQGSASSEEDDDEGMDDEGDDDADEDDNDNNEMELE